MPHSDFLSFSVIVSASRPRLGPRGLEDLRNGVWDVFLIGDSGMLFGDPYNSHVIAYAIEVSMDFDSSRKIAPRCE